MDRKRGSGTKNKMASALKFFAVLAFLTLIPVEGRTDADGNWKLRINKENLKVYTRIEGKGKINEGRATGIIQAGIREVASHIENISSYTRWMEGCIRANLHKQIDENKKIVYSVNKLPWPLNLILRYLHSPWQYDFGALP